MKNVNKKNEVNGFKFNKYMTLYSTKLKPLSDQIYCTMYINFKDL